MQPAMPPYAPTPPPSRSGRVWPAAIAGFVLAALIFLVLVLAGVVRSDDDSAPSRAAIAMPKTVGAYSWTQLVEKKLADGHKIGPQLASARLVSARTSAALSAAHDGAGAAVQGYADAELKTLYTVLAVRDATPPPVVAVTSPKLLGLAEPFQRIEHVGTSYCEIFAVRTTAYGQKPPPDADTVSACQRSSGSLTVTVQGGLQHDPRQVVAFLDQVWNALN